VVKSQQKLEIPALTKNGVQQILETYDLLHSKDPGEMSSYMRINSSKNSQGEESVVLRVQQDPQPVSMK
jgi:hypothetical protein